MENYQDPKGLMLCPRCTDLAHPIAVASDGWIVLLHCSSCRYCGSSSQFIQIKDDPCSPGSDSNSVG